MKLMESDIKLNEIKIEPQLFSSSEISPEDPIEEHRHQLMIMHRRCSSSIFVPPTYYQHDQHFLPYPTYNSGLSLVEMREPWNCYFQQSDIYRIENTEQQKGLSQFDFENGYIEAPISGMCTTDSAVLQQQIYHNGEMLSKLNQHPIQYNQNCTPYNTDRPLIDWEFINRNTDNYCNVNSNEECTENKFEEKFPSGSPLDSDDSLSSGNLIFIIMSSVMTNYINCWYDHI